MNKRCMAFVLVGLFTLLLLLPGCLTAEPGAGEARAQVVPVTASPRLASAKADKSATGAKFHSYTSSVTCEGLLASMGGKEGQSDAMLAIGAFMTGVNYAKGRDVNIDLKTLSIMTENHCRQNPKQTLTDALIAVDRSLDFAQLRQQQIATKIASATAVNPSPKVAPLAPAADKGKSLPRATAGGAYLVQVLSTTVDAEAQRMIAVLKGKNFPAYIEQVSLKERGLWHRVVVGPYDDQLSAEQVAVALREEKFQTMVRQR